MKNVKRTILDIIIIMGISFLIGFGFGNAFGANLSEPLAPVKRKAPEIAFHIPNEEIGVHVPVNNNLYLLSQFRGNVVALEFIETWCPHCQAASHIMSRLQEKYHKYGFMALDIAFNDNAKDHIMEFVNQQQTKFPVGWTERNEVLAFTGFSVIQRFVVPQLILIDRKGYIHWETPALGDEYSYEESTIEHRIQVLLKMRK